MKRSRYIITLAMCLYCIGSMGLAQDTTVVDSSRMRHPGKALLFSFVPGGGQLYNQHPLKALLFSGLFIYYSAELIRTDKEYQAISTDKALHRIRNDKIWLMALTWTLNIVDAYVDAQLWDFNKYEIDDSGIPEPQTNETKNTEAIHDTN